MECVFCKIIHGEMATKKIAENDTLIVIQDIFAMAQQLSQTVEGAHDFKLHVNSGKNAGQIVMHLHVHFTAGKLTGIL